MDEKREQAMGQLKTASPLEMTSLLKELELYDKESSQKVIDDVYEQFASGENMQDEILVPVFSAVVDGLLEATSFGRKARKKGLTASRVIQECKEFSYDDKTKHGTSVNAFTEYKNANNDGIEGCLLHCNHMAQGCGDQERRNQRRASIAHSNGNILHSPLAVHQAGDGPVGHANQRIQQKNAGKLFQGIYGGGVHIIDNEIGADPVQ